MKPSISRKFFLTVFIANIILVAVMASLVVIFTKGLERDFLQQDYIEERDFILSENPQDEIIRHRTKSIIIEFVPERFLPIKAHYPVFEGLQPVEQLVLERDAHRYVINVQKIQGGVFFHARDISQILAREHRFLQTMAIVCLLVIIISFILAYTGSRRVMLPLKTLSKHLKETQVGKEVRPIDIEFRDIELHEISTVFNQFLVELGKYVDRERSLVSMAGHELKTPVSVILGAIEVIRSRHPLVGSEGKLLDRIEDAAAEMSSNISILLKLSRRGDGADVYHNINMMKMIDDVLEDLGESFSVHDRVSVNNNGEDLVISADPVLVKMLIRNLIQNALQHTDGNIELSLTSDSFKVVDHGKGVSSDVFQIPKINTSDFERNPNGGLGLFIVTLICERLGWPLSVAGNHLMGSTVKVQFPE